MSDAEPHHAAEASSDRHHSSRDAEKLRLHLAMATRLRADPDHVLATARENLAWWVQRNGAEPYYLEWQEILTTCTPEEIIALILAEDDRGQHLRQTSPFAGVLTPEEREAAIQGQE